MNQNIRNNEASSVFSRATSTSASPNVANNDAEKSSMFAQEAPSDEIFEDILSGLGVRTSYIRNALERQKVSNRPIADVARDTGLISAEKVAMALGRKTGFPYFKSVDLDKISHTDIAFIKRVLMDAGSGTPGGFKFTDYIPLGVYEGSLMVAISNIGRSQEAKNTFSKYKPRLVIASDKTIQSVYRKFFSNTDLAFDAAVKAAMASINGLNEANVNAVQDLLGELMRHACFVGASDVYLFSDEKEGAIKLKIGGRGQVFRYIHKDLFDRLAQVIVASTGKAENLSKAPVDAKLTFKDGLEVRYKDIAERYVFRLSIVRETPQNTVVVTRINDSQSSEAEFDHLGFDAETISSIKKQIMNPDGLVLISGPTGSGKTTTLYAILREINSIERQILTMEKPREYKNNSWIQYELKGDKDEGDESREMLNAMLRQSPNVIFMGELRDNFDLAKVCVTAANTGHLVFSTIHTNDAASTITRLLDLKISPSGIANTLRFVLAMRLIPTLCSRCKISDTRSETRIELLSDYISKDKRHEHTPCMINPSGCPDCGFTGLRGRKSVYEYMDGKAAGALLIKNESINSIREQVIQKEHSMWGRGLALVAKGLVSIDDVILSVGKP